MDIRVIETILAVASFFILRFATIKFLSKIQTKYDYSKYRMRPILKFINLAVFIILVTIIIAIWGVEQTKLLTFITSVLAVIGIALFAQWSILSNISSALIIFISHPVKLGESITIIDKEFDITGRVSDIGLFYVIMKTETDEKIMIPNNLFLQKATKINSGK
ncbi:mechanosensitive ion channel domain-containing protein [Flavobacterium degerlachei]|jgi:small-conductance mechanosensitive channel|uniref:Mechanosensitive ion channel n=1 Tax=Flavobacterium degerlachei TaxID=229203 RepID=A0A1H2UJT4_9FLAO|nr:mechanosensitive ion channel domain-containing protein [Flavobacterium degerlachei]SDW56385.1 Mechanosensitive ion channel [Flavobacterium degerlachei]